VITSDFTEADETYRAGQTILDNVEIYNCSQYDTMKSALRFEGAIYRESIISRSSIHHGLGWGLHITNSENIHLYDNVFFDFVSFGVQI